MQEEFDFDSLYQEIILEKDKEINKLKQDMINLKNDINDFKNFVTKQTNTINSKKTLISELTQVMNDILKLYPSAIDNQPANVLEYRINVATQVGLEDIEDIINYIVSRFDYYDNKWLLNMRETINNILHKTKNTENFDIVGGTYTFIYFRDRVGKNTGLTKQYYIRDHFGQSDCFGDIHPYNNAHGSDLKFNEYKIRFLIETINNFIDKLNRMKKMAINFGYTHDKKIYGEEKYVLPSDNDRKLINGWTIQCYTSVIKYIDNVLDIKEEICPIDIKTDNNENNILKKDLMTNEITGNNVIIIQGSNSTTLNIK